MTHAEEFENFVGPVDQEDDFGLCAACHDYPCACDDDDILTSPDCCQHCGKPFEEFGDIGCGYCDRRSPDWGEL